MKFFTDDFGGIYSADRKTLLHCPNVESYRVAEGTAHLDKNAFRDCCFLEEIELPWTIDQSVNYAKTDITEEEYDQKYEGSDVLMQDIQDLDDEQREQYAEAWHQLFDGHEFIIPFTANTIQWKHPYSQEEYETHCTLRAWRESITDEYGVAYSKDGKRVLYTKPEFDIVTEYHVRDGVVSICEEAFRRWPSDTVFLPLKVHIPDSVQFIDEDAFPYYTREGNTFVFNHELLNDPDFSPF